MKQKWLNLPLENFSKPRCMAHNRSGALCTRFPMKNGRCRLHGGLSTGAKTLEGKRRSRWGNTQHGMYSIYFTEERKEFRRFMRQWKETEAAILRGF